MYIDRKLVIVAAAFAGSVTAAPVPEASGVLIPDCGHERDCLLPPKEPIPEIGIPRIGTTEPITKPILNEKRSSPGSPGDGVNGNGDLTAPVDFNPPPPFTEPELPWLKNIESRDVQKRTEPFVSPSTPGLETPEQIEAWLKSISLHRPTPDKRSTNPIPNLTPAQIQQLEQFLRDPGLDAPLVGKRSTNPLPHLTPAQIQQLEQFLRDPGLDAPLVGKRSEPPSAPHFTPEQWQRIEQITDPGLFTPLGVGKRSSKREVSPQQFQQEIKGWMDSVCKGKSGPVHVGPGYIGGGYDITCP